MMELPDERYAAADAADLVCQKAHCQREDCNGFLCRNAIDAAILAERLSATERAAKIAKHRYGVARELDSNAAWAVFEALPDAIRSQP